ncbi:MAG: hypothetical protein HY795_17390 [Desulfovibrio sp.]|nr:hypothetical protein [Desulfovibrio sp.]
MIRSGKVEEIDWNIGEWVFVDIGFSKKSSCGFIVADENCMEISFAGLKERMYAYVSMRSLSVQKVNVINLVIEAPLSVCFDKNGNPKGRRPEKIDGKTRYWYVGPGCSVLLAATYLLKHISNIQFDGEIRLFEGFVSFKDSSQKRNHCHDAKCLQNIVKNIQRHKHCIIDRREMLFDSSDIILSAFEVHGMDFGVPPIIMYSNV